MANTNNPKGFIPAVAVNKINTMARVKYQVAASQTISPNDIVGINSSGYVTSDVSAGVLGIALEGIRDGRTGYKHLIKTASSSTAGLDTLVVWTDPSLEMIAQITVGALTDPYTTSLSPNCFDPAGTSGAMYIDAGASALDIFRIVGPAYESYYGGDYSEYGAYQKVKARFNQARHIFGTRA